MTSNVILKLLRWYRKNKRELPWRDVVDKKGKPDAYKIFISEIMLQQTQVDRVIPKYILWLKTFPSWHTLSRATNADVIRAWAGLGYNRRALMTRNAARHVVHNSVPKTEDEWRALPGVGPYTAAALTGFVNHRRAVAIDTNVRRVAGRVFNGIPYPQLKDHERVHRKIAKNLPKTGKFWEVPAAFMDLGSAICTSKNPSCHICPLRSECRAKTKIQNGAEHVPLTKSKERIHRNKKFPDRIYRGRILSLVTSAPQHIDRLGNKIDETFNAQHDQEWIERMVERMTRDQLVERENKKVFLTRTNS